MVSSVQKIHLVVDMQLLQTSDRKRGMGFYLVGLLGALQLQDLTITCVINSRLAPLADKDIELTKRLGAEMLEVDLLHQGDYQEFANSATVNRQRIDKALTPILTKYADTKIIYFMPALFSSEIHPVFPSLGTTNLLLFYDLIPFLYYRHYFRDHEGVPRKDYAQRFREFYRADHYASISQTTSDDLMMYFGVDPTRITSIFGAAADRRELTPQQPKSLQGLKHGFVLMPSGDDFRKNNLLAVQAFAALNTESQLVVTSRFSDGTKRELKALCPNITFVGSVTDTEFLWLFDNAKVIFFPPEYEGLGMPLLEAVERDAIVACSNIPVFAEISQETFFYFDPASIRSMTAALEEALKADKQKYLRQAKAEYKRIKDTFSWENTAKNFTDALRESVPAGPRTKLAIFCPSPSSYSSVGKYAFEVHAELSRLFDIDYYAEDGLTIFEPTRPNILEFAAGYDRASSFTPASAKQYDYILYNLGNSEFHIDTILNALRLPANAIVHDTRLNGIFDWLERQGFLTTARHQVEIRLDELSGTTDTNCLTSLTTNQKSVFVHSAFARSAVDKLTADYRTSVMQTIHPIGVPIVQLKRIGSPIVSFAGIISESKGINMVSEIARNKKIQVRVFGFGVLGDSPLLQNLGDNVRVMKDLTDKEFQDLLRQTLILVNYRPKYHGETSRSALEAMRHGAVVIVKDIGWYSELPDDTVVKVTSESEVVSAVEELIADPDRVQAISKSARAYLTHEYNYKKYADMLKKGMEKQA